MRNLVLAALVCFSGCAAMHKVTGDSMFAVEEPDRTVRGPVVPEPEPTEPSFEAELKQASAAGTEDELPALPQPKKKSSKVAVAPKR